MEDEKYIQIGFDEGFKNGVVLGRICGEIYAQAKRAKISNEIQNQECSKSKILCLLRKVLFEIIPEGQSTLAEVISEVRSIASFIDGYSLESTSFEHYLSQHYYRRQIS
jgi:hypothetical protein